MGLFQKWFLNMYRVWFCITPERVWNFRIRVWISLPSRLIFAAITYEILMVFIWASKFYKESCKNFANAIISNDVIYVFENDDPSHGFEQSRHRTRSSRLVFLDATSDFFRVTSEIKFSSLKLCYNHVSNSIVFSTSRLKFHWKFRNHVCKTCAAKPFTLAG